MLKTTVNEMVLWDFMTKNNLSQKEMAGRLGVSPGYVSQILCGLRHPSPKLRRTMLEAMQPLTFSDLFTVEGQAEECRQRGLPPRPGLALSLCPAQ